MTSLRVFEDSDCTTEVDRVLYEGRVYFLRFPTSDAGLIKAALAEAGLADFVGWHRLNPVATLRVVNRIGVVTLFGRVLDIRSTKLLEAETGDRQFQLILDDLAALSRHILFDRSAAPGAERTHRAAPLEPSLLERFNFYRQTCLPVGKRPGLEVLVRRVLLNPHSKLVDVHVPDHIWNAKRPSRQTLRSLFHHGQTFMRLPEDHFLVAGRPGLKVGGTGESIIPTKALRSRGTITFDTAENRFIKHLLLDVGMVCRDVLRTALVSGSLLEQCKRLLNISRALLHLDFFREIGQLQAIPSSSPTLTRRHGYRELYEIFLRCRTGAKHLFEDLADESLAIELKDVALLYEYWVFYKTAATLLKPGAVLEARSAIVKDGRIVNSCVVTDGAFAIHFNRTFTRKPGGSYSLRLRPDVVIEKVGKVGHPAMFILDAKYKSTEVESSEGEDYEDELLAPTRVVKAADVHKMHCYADAIEEVASAVAVYPGTEFIFYQRDRSAAPILEPQTMFSLEGVGAVPLLPGSESDSFEVFLTPHLAEGDAGS